MDPGAMVEGASRKTISRIERGCYMPSAEREAAERDGGLLPTPGAGPRDRGRDAGGRQAGAAAGPPDTLPSATIPGP